MNKAKEMYPVDKKLDLNKFVSITKLSNDVSFPKGGFIVIEQEAYECYESGDKIVMLVDGKSKTSITKYDKDGKVV